MNRFLLAGLMAGSWSSCVLAADLGSYQPRYEPEYGAARSNDFDWRGVYVGANAGYGWGSDHAATLSGPGAGGAFGTLDPDGWYGGAQVGFNAQFDHLVVGIEADLQGTDISDSTSGIGPGPFFGTANVDIDWFSTVRGRIGYATGPTLLYVTGGLAFADVDYSVSGATLAGPGVSMSKSSIKTGYTLGGGLEWAFTPDWSLKTEYLYVDLGDETLSNGAFSARSETDFQTVRVGLNYHF